MDAIDHPEERRTHTASIPRLGGIGIASGTLISLLAFTDISNNIIAYITGAIVISVTGLIDDIHGLNPKIKLSGQVIATSLFLYISGTTLTDFGDLFGLGNIQIGWMALPITLICMVGVINAMNLSDGLDGLAGGTAVIASTFFCAFAYITHNWEALSISLALVAAILGFLKFNAHPAKIFMGDTGSLLIGYSLAATAILLVQPSNAQRIAPISLALILAIPITDTLLVMLRRIKHGQHPFHPDKTHLHHRLLHLGFTHAAVTPILYGWSTMLGVLAISLASIPEYIQFTTGILFITLLFGSVILLQHSGFQWRGQSDQKSHPPSDINKRLKALAAASIKPYVLFAGMVLGLAIIFLRLPQGNTMAYACMLIATFLALFFPWKESGNSSRLIRGLTYLGILAVVGAHEIAQENFHFWKDDYLSYLGILTIIWATFKIALRKNREVFLTSGFEFLILFIAFVVPAFILPFMQIDESTLQIIQRICVKSVPFLVAIKILQLAHPEWNRGVMLSLILGLLGWAIPAI